MLDLGEDAALRVVEGTEEKSWAALSAGLDPGLSERLSGFPAHLQRRAIAGGRDGLALLIGRPLAAYRKFVPLSVSRDALDPDDLAPLWAEAERLASEEGWELRAEDHPWAGATPYYRQSTGFTCGPATLAMALSGLGGHPPPDRHLEIQLWREATTVHAPAGPGGCDPFGLALAAARRGLHAEVIKSRPGAQFLDRAADEDKRELMRFVQEAFREEAEAAGIPIAYRSVETAHLAAHCEKGWQVLLLVDQQVMHGEGAPHWILLIAHRDGIFRAHDPWLDTAQGETAADVIDLPLPHEAIRAIASYGVPAYQAAVLLSRP